MISKKKKKKKKKKRVTALLDLWAQASYPKRPSKWFAEDSVFDSGIDQVGLDEFLWRIEKELPWSQISTLSGTEDNESVAIFFEDIEGVTQLKQRIAWSIRFHDDRVCRIIQANAVIPH